MQHRWLKRAALSAALVMAFAAGEARAQVAVMPLGRGYAGVSGGFIIPQDINGTFSGAIAGTGKLSFKTGGAVSGFVGYHVTPILAVEGEFSYASFDADKFSGTLNGVTVTEAIDGHVNAFTGLANLIVTPLGRGRFTPYLGGGIGIASFEERVNSIGGTFVGARDDFTDAAADFIAGADFTIVPRWSVGVRYRFFWVNTGGTTTTAGVSVKQDDFTAHVITANATFHF
jgi:opacity protein-like surface antigen